MAWRLAVVEQVVSTNTALWEAPSDKAKPGQALLAWQQTGGKGRAGRTWVSPRGGLYLSVCLKPAQPEGLSLLGAAAVVRLVRQLGVEARIRWPNDVTVRGRKLAGVLPVARFQGSRLERAVLGVGLNVSASLEAYPEEVRESLTALAWEATGQAAQRSVLGLAWMLLASLEQESQALDAWGLARYCRHWESSLEGLADRRRPRLVEEGGGVRPLAAVAGLGPRGELRLVDGTVLDRLGPTQRLHFVGPDLS